MPYVRTDAGVFVPKHLRQPAAKPTAVVYWYSAKLNHILKGPDEHFGIPPFHQRLGYQKVVCRSAHEADLWSQKLRDQERREGDQKDEERERFEGPIRAMLRSDIHERMANAGTMLERAFCRYFLDQLDTYERQNKMKRISYQHAEAFEDGK